MARVHLVINTIKEYERKQKKQQARQEAFQWDAPAKDEPDTSNTVTEKIRNFTGEADVRCPETGKKFRASFNIRLSEPSNKITFEQI